ncbi:lactonase family protein [Sinomonas halotolerans]|uniref:Beta-propeller fold lactonase family protein n=1 Tax=Sinomonas halotolerans TaxID=1644133 RepID=A0ABU9X7D7_9MICC
MSRTFAFLACASGATVDTLSLDTQTGQLDRVSRVAGLGRVSALALDPAGTLYAAVNSEPRRTLALALDPAGGAPDPVADRPVPVSSCYLSLTEDGTRLLSASYHEGLALGYPVPAEDQETPGSAATAGLGGLTEYRSGRNTHSALPSPDGRFAYTASLGDDRISWFALDAAAPGSSAHDAGTVAPSGYVACEPGSGPRHIVFDRTGRHAFVLHELSGDVTVYERDAETGALDLVWTASAVEGLELLPGLVRSPATEDPGQGVVWCADLRLTPDGRFLFTTERSTSTVAALLVHEHGKLEFLRHTMTEAQPRGMAIDPTGQFLLVAGERSNHVTSYRIDPEDGTLEDVSRVETADGPLWIECWTPAAG